jgi:hypothetical protein
MASDLELLSTLSNVTREAHMKKVEYSGNKEDWLFNHIKTDPIKHAGESLVNFSLKYQLPESAAYSSENLAHPSCVQPAWAKGQLYIKKLLAKMQYSEEVVHLNKGENAIVKGLLDLRDGTYDVYKLLRDHSIHTPGSGILASATATYSGQTFTADSVRWLRVGMVIDGYHGASQDADSIVITGINPTTKVVTCTGGMTGIDSDTDFYYEDTYTNGATISTTKYTNGIETICSDVDPAYGNFEGLDRDTYEYAKATAAHGSSSGTAEAFTLDRLYDLIELGIGNVGLAKLPKFALADQKTLRAIYQAFRDEQQPTINMPATEGMPETLGFKYGSHEIRMYADYRSAPNTLWMPNSNYMVKYSGGPEGWDNYGGGVRFVSGYQAFYEVYRGWWNYGTIFPQANLALYDITGA